MIEKDFEDEGQPQEANKFLKIPFTQAKIYQITALKFNFVGYEIFLK